MPRMTGSRMLAEMLKGYGVTHVFFVPTILMDALAEMDSLGIQKILTHGEKAAAYMADGYARAKNAPGVCMAQQIGASNLAAGLRDPFMACSPVVAITGGPATASRYRGAYQEVEDFTQFDSVTKLSARVDDLARFPDLVRQAFRVATSGSPGPVHLRLLGLLGEPSPFDRERGLAGEGLELVQALWSLQRARIVGPQPEHAHRAPGADQWQIQPGRAG